MTWVEPHQQRRRCGQTGRAVKERDPSPWADLESKGARRTGTENND